ncbi:MAG: hypothetical protein B7W98_00075 [Parcubacteria group bacterium 20-58-5]|nr:MAG: hypothetical protein B7W98_00075 [Parcubacteria group bacterium 20-58-5]OYV63094.1 MAG: hypothetical protein B7X03_03155 [Parcubacteria group bacterium 21-58-10]
MRVEPFGVGSIVHITQRGTRGTDIMRDVADGMRIVRTFRYLNDTHTDQFWHHSVADLPALARPDSWPKRDPLVRILAWTLLSNHFHLLVQEIREGGIAKFMQRTGGSMSKYFSAKYNEKGSLFQGSYHARTVAEDEHYRYLAFYILVKNVLEMYPGGLAAAAGNFDDAWEWAKRYPYASFRDIVSGTASPILDDEDSLIAGIIGMGDAYKQEARELLDFHMATRGKEFKELMLEPW